MHHSLSIVIPVAPGESALRNLLSELSILEGISEILLATPETDCEVLQNTMNDFKSAIPLRRVISPAGRANQMNFGAREAQAEFLWFLHADTVITATAWDALQRSVQIHPGDLHYFDLTFTPGGPFLMRLNAWGTWIRSHCFKMPFGDQGFCLSKSRFQELGGYDESLAYGEDHAFIWKARAAGLQVRSTRVAVETSARKYQQHGWLRTTFTHFWLTWKQALPGFLRLLRKRWSP